MGTSRKNENIVVDTLAGVCKYKVLRGIDLSYASVDMIYQLVRFVRIVPFDRVQIQIWNRPVR